jgi:hypothetical protein
MSAERHYRVTWEIDVWTASPAEAVKAAADTLQEPTRWVYGVEDAKTGEKWVIDTDLL